MAAAVALFGLVILVVAVVGVVLPARLIDWVTRVWRSEAGLYVAVLARLVLGVLLLAAASSTRFPNVIRVIGIIALVAAVLIPIVGRTRIDRLIQWLAEQPTVIVRSWCGLACLFGAFLIYAAL